MWSYEENKSFEENSSSSSPRKRGSRLSLPAARWVPAFAGTTTSLLVLCAPAFSAEIAPTEVQLSQRAEKIVARDQIGVSLRVEAKGNEPRQLQDEVNRRMSEALAKAKKFPSVRSSTGGYSVVRAYDAKAPQAWQAMQSLVMESGNLQDCLALAGQLQGDGLVISNMRFFVSPKALAAVQDELTAQAIGELRARSERVADNLGLKLQSMKSVEVGNTAEQAAPMPMRFATAEAAPSSTPPAAEPGETTVSVTVTATVLMVPR